VDQRNQAVRTLRPLSLLRTFLNNEAAGGIVLMAVAVLALIIANSALAPGYFRILKTEVLSLSVLHWINDALMAVFFLLVGLEIKREMLDGQLSSWPRRALPGIAALGGMVVPALIYVAVNWSTPETLRGWAIPAATDIAFALGVLALLGSRVPPSLKIFLTALAIIDDLGAVLIIALFYTGDLSVAMLAGAGVCLLALIALNRAGAMVLGPYLALGAMLWFFVLQSGVHATVAGVMLAMTVPLRRSPGRPQPSDSPLHNLEHALHPWVAFAIVPIFGFANAGVSFDGVSPSVLHEAVPLGVGLGLLVGKQIGVFASAWAAIRSGLADLPANATSAQCYGVAVLCGIGFTMSLFIGALAFPYSPELVDATKLGVLSGSALSALVGYTILRLARPQARRPIKKLPTGRA
jgi:NhaA family Na+:H+ antiporter